MTEDQLDDIIEDIMTSTWESGKTKILDFARLMCDRQKEICAGAAKFVYGEVDVEGAIHKEPVDIDWQSVINSPYPEELL